MTVIITDTGFHTDDWSGSFVAIAEWLEADATEARALDLTSDADPSLLSNQLPKIEMIRIDFPSFADGRGFTIARRLRLMGYKGRLRAKGHVISDQYAMARRAGFDEVEISDELAQRQPENEWKFRANWRDNDFQSRLRAG